MSSYIAGRAYIEFTDPETGKVVKGLSQPIPRHNMLRLHVEARDMNGRRTGLFEGPWNTSTTGFTTAVIDNIFGLSKTVTTYSGNSLVLGLQPVYGSLTIYAGTYSTVSASWADTQLSALVPSTSGNVLAVVGTVNTSSQSFPVTGTISNGTTGNITYAEVGLAVGTPASSNSGSILLTHDTFAGLTVSPSGTLAVTYYIQFS